MPDTGALWLSLAEFDERAGDHPIVFVALDGACPPLPGPLPTRAGVFVGVDRGGAVPAGLENAFDVLLTTNEQAPAPWVGLTPAGVDQAVALLSDAVAAHPLAATVLAQVLRCGEGQTFEQALLLESLAYSTLQGGAECRSWRSRQPARVARPAATGVVRLERRGDGLQIVLARPEVHNAFGARMRDEFVEAMQLPLLDPSIRRVVVTGEGPSFCSGGDLLEFGTASDPATAHAVRLQHSAALLVHRLAERVEVRVHGACIGAGIEVSAAAGHVSARRDAWFRLPEVGMGLLPGAGGTASIPRRIGRHRACYMALTGANIDTRTALRWKLVDAVTEDA